MSLPGFIPAEVAARTTVYPSHEEWLADRTDRGAMRVGGTTAAALVGLSAFRGPWDVWADYHAPEGYKRPQADAATLSAGLWWEPHIRQWYAEHAPADVWSEPCMVRGILPWMVASVDGFVLRDGEVGLLEIKTARSREGWGKDGETAETANDHRVAPLGYVVQCYWYMAVTGLPWTDLVVMFGPQDVRTYRIMADKGYQATLARRVMAARQRYMVDGEQPDPDASDACVASMNARHREGEEPITPEVLAAAREYDTVKDARAEAQKAEKLAKARLLAAMGDTETFTTTNRDGEPYRVLWTTGSRIYTNLPKGEA